MALNKNGIVKNWRKFNRLVHYLMVCPLSKLHSHEEALKSPGPCLNVSIIHISSFCHVSCPEVTFQFIQSIDLDQPEPFMIYIY